MEPGAPIKEESEPATLEVPNETKKGTCLHFDPSKRNYIEGSNTKLPQVNDPRTIEASIHVKSDSAGWQDIFTYGEGGGKRSGLAVAPGGNIAYLSGMHKHDVHGGRYVRHNLWFHCAATYDGTTLKIYVDGKLSAAEKMEEGLQTTGTTFCLSKNVGADGGYFNGRIDEVRVWNYARTQEQIREFQEGELTGNEDGLVAYYNFNEGVAGGDNTGITKLTDLTGNGDGTLYNFVLKGNKSNWLEEPGGTA